MVGGARGVGEGRDRGLMGARPGGRALFIFAGWVEGERMRRLGRRHGVGGCGVIQGKNGGAAWRSGRVGRR